MMLPTPSVAAFRALERALVRRRFQSLEPRLRIELALIALLIGGFLFWQARVPLDGVVRGNGPLFAAGSLLGALALLAAAGGALAGARHAARLTRGSVGPPWLALPIPPHPLARHFAWGSSIPSLLFGLPALAFLAAGVGLLPFWWLVLLGASFAWMLIECTHLGCALALRIRARRADPRPGLAPLVRVLVSRAQRREPGRTHAGRWRRDPAWAALWRKDLALTLRPTPARRLAPLPILLTALSVVAWMLPLDPRLKHLVAFALALLASATYAEWLIAVAGTDPFPVLRGLPVGVLAVWGARVGWVGIGVAVLIGAHGAATRGLSPAAQALFLTWLGGAALAIGLLGANYGVTLYPRADHAQRMLWLSLGLAMAASLMIPLFGWVLLLTAVLHSTRRLPRWGRLEART